MNFLYSYRYFLSIASIKSSKSPSNTKNSHILKIKQVYPYVKEIHQPEIQGRIHEVYFIKTLNNDEFVCRFSQKNIAVHNLYVSRLLNFHNIKVPNISLHKFNDEYCETYPFIKGKTFYERIEENISEEAKLQVYNQLVHIVCKISQIPYKYKTKTEVPLTAKIAIDFFKKLNMNNVALCHTDLHAKNVVLDNQDNVVALLDLDAVYPESLAFAFINIIKDAQTYGCNTENLIKLVQGTYVNPKFIGIKAQTKLYSGIKRISKSMLSDSMIKQLLKIRLK